MSETTLNNKLFYLSILAVILLFCIVEYSLISKGFYALSADESGHTLEANEWYKGESQLFSIWLPFYKVLNGLALKIHYDLIVTPRFVSLLFGLSTLLCLMMLTYHLFENKIIVLLTGFYAAILSPIAVFSVLPLIEIYYFFFVIASIMCFLLWVKHHQNSFLWITVFLLIIGTTTRYEAWIFAFIIFTLIVNEIVRSERTSSQKLLLIISIVILIAFFPVYWIYLTTISSASSTEFISSVTSRYREGYFITEIKNNALYQFLQINVSSLNIIGLASLFYLFKVNMNVKKLTVILFSTLITFSILSFLIKAMPTHNYWRLAMIWSLLLLPFTVYWLNHLIENSKVFPINKYLSFIFFILLVYFFNSQTSSYTSYSYFIEDDLNAGKYLEEVIDEENSKIFIVKDASDKWRFSNLLVASQKPDKFVSELGTYNYVSSDSISINSDFVTEMIHKNVKFLVLPSSKEIEDYSNRLILIKSFAKWHIYKVN